MNNEEEKAYSSDTKPIVDHLLNATHGAKDEWPSYLKELFALAPVDAAWFNPVTEYYSGNMPIDGDDWVEIPARDRRLNELAEWDETQWNPHYMFGWLVDGQLWIGNDKEPRDPPTVFTRKQWQERRELRITAGLIDVNDTDVVDIPKRDINWEAKYLDLLEKHSSLLDKTNHAMDMWEHWKSKYEEK